jgi:hypothetical protein
MTTKLRKIAAAASLILPLIALASDTQHYYLRDADSPTASTEAVPVPSSFFVARLFPRGGPLSGLALRIVKQSGPDLESKHDETFVPVGAHIANSVSETLGKWK